MAVHPDPTLALRPLSVADVRAMVDAGILGPEDHCELIDGVLVAKMTMGGAHEFGVRKLMGALLPAALEHGLEISPQCPMDVLAEFSLPEPDVAVIPATPGLRSAADALLVVEVSVSSLRLDLGRKAQLYAAAGIPEYWVLDADARELHAHRSPGRDGYAELTTCGETDEVRALKAELVLRVGDALLPG